MGAQPRRVWQLPVFVMGLASVWAAATYVTPPPTAHARSASTADELQSALNRTPVDAREIEPLVRALADTPEHTPRSRYLLGSAYVALASEKPTDSPDLWKLAAMHFEACDATALKPDEQTKLVFRQAKAKAAVGVGEPKSLIAALMTVPPGEDKTECPRLIAECALRMDDAKRAKEELTIYLGSANKASPAMADRYKLKLAELCAASGEMDRARRWYKDVSASAPPEVMAAAKECLALDAYMQKNWPEAIRLLDEALTLPNLPPADKSRMWRNLGLAHKSAGDLDAALPFLEKASREPGIDGSLASFNIAEIRGTYPMGKGKRGEAIDWLERAVSQIPNHEMSEYANQQFDAIIGTCLSEADFSSAARALQAYRSVNKSPHLIRKQATVEAAWGTALRGTSMAQAKAHWESAALHYLHHAEMGGETLDKQFQDIRLAAELYKWAGKPEDGLKVLDKLLESKAKLDGAVVAMVQFDRSKLLPPTDIAGMKTALEDALSQPGPQSLAAKLKLATMNIQQGTDAKNPEMAEFGKSLLRQVAELSNVTTENQATHEQALFELGRLCLKDGKFTDAEARFKKQISLYPNGSFAGYGRLWLVCSLLQQARQPDASKKLLEDALTHLAPLTESNDAYLRTYGEIWTANTHLELGNIADALTRSKALMAKYQGKPEELVAGKLLYYAYLKLPTPEPAEASRVLDRMEAAFAALPATAYPNDPEYSHERWKTQLPALRAELRAFQK